MMNDDVSIFVPGRLCILGEHSDWAAGYRTQNKKLEKGYAIVAGLNLGVYLKGRKSSGFSYEYNGNRINLSCNQLMTYSQKDFFEYVVSSARIMHMRYEVFGANIVCEKMTLPMKKGLASSAAVCVSIIRMYNLLYDLNLSVEEEMALAYEAEISTGSMCGKMDQICAFGQGLRKICFDGDKIEVVPLKIKKELFFILVDLNGSKDTKKILSDLNAIYPVAKNEKEDKLINSLGLFNKKCVADAEKYLLDGDIKKFAGILKTYQKNFDENIACFSTELKAPLLHRLIDFSDSLEGVFVCKGVGSQGDGMAQILVKNEEKSKKIIEIIRKNFSLDGYVLKVGQQSINAIVPIAGKGTRMYPFTHIVDKALLPVVDHGKVYPALVLILRELYYCNNINKIDLIINENQCELVYRLKSIIKKENIDISLFETLQIKNEFGGAIVSSKFIHEIGFTLVCLGDYIYRGNKYGDCTQQLIDFWEKNQKSVVSIKSIDVEKTNLYGIVYGTWINKDVLKIEKIVEKPDSDYVKRNLLLYHEGTRKAFSFFGEYIIDNDMLRKMFFEENNKKSFSEYLNEYVQNFPMYALVVRGESFDLGNPNDYYLSFVEYGKDTL